MGRKCNRLQQKLHKTSAKSLALAAFLVRIGFLPVIWELPVLLMPTLDSVCTCCSLFSHPTSHSCVAKWYPGKSNIEGTAEGGLLQGSDSQGPRASTALGEGRLTVQRNQKGWMFSTNYGAGQK